MQTFDPAVRQMNAVVAGVRGEQLGEPTPCPGYTVGLEELVAHGWDLARATGQPSAADPGTVEAAIEVMTPMSGPGMESARAPAFGPVVAAGEAASRLEHLLALTGRDPGWTAG